jgi:hypothetical protein
MFLILFSSYIDGFSVPATTFSRAVMSNHGMRGAVLTTLLLGRGIDPPEHRDLTMSVEDGIQIDMRQKKEEEISQLVSAAKDANPPPLSSPGSSSTKGLRFLGHYFANWLRNLYLSFQRNRPPLDIDDANLLLYDVILLMNLSASISLFVTHRLQYYYIPSSLNEGALLSTCWIIAGLANGAFLSSAVDGHYDPRGVDYEEKGGPGAAGLLAVSTFVMTSSLRIIFALALAILEHRQVGSGGEELIPLEIPFGLALMSAWRTLHSANTPRI